MGNNDGTSSSAGTILLFNSWTSPAGWRAFIVAGNHRPWRSTKHFAPAIYRNTTKFHWLIASLKRSANNHRWLLSQERHCVTVPVESATYALADLKADESANDRTSRAVINLSQDYSRLTWGARWQNSSSVREANVAPSTLKLSSGTEGNCSCLLAHWIQAATSAALQRRGSAIIPIVSNNYRCTFIIRYYFDIKLFTSSRC